MLRSLLFILTLVGSRHVTAQCPFMNGNAPVTPRDETPSSPEYIAEYEVDDSNQYMTSDGGGPIDDQFSLRAGLRGPTLLEDFRLRQKIQHFDHERVPERAVHARGAGAFGTFTSYGDYSDITAASFLSEQNKSTPVFVRFSTVAGSRGSTDTARDVHGFATRWYTDEGNFDLVGNNIPVFFIQDGIRFPDLIHAVKPSPDNEIPQAATAHDSAWDFFSGQPSTLHTLFWAMSGHGIPRSYRHMDGFGVNTYRFVNDKGESKLVKWHWKTRQGKASLVWEEAQAISGQNPDFHRRDLWDAIESRNFPEWELAVQLINEEDALRFGIDLLDPTKIIPEEFVPLKYIGKMTLDRNPVDYFATVEQVMFQPGHIVRGIDFSEDPLLQARLFSYLDTQLNRHGGPNFEQIPVNQPRVEVHNNNRDGAGQMRIHKNKFSYTPNTGNKGSPAQSNYTHGGGFFSAPSRKAGQDLVKALPSGFDDHWTQPRLFYNSLTPFEQQTLINAIRFETSHISLDLQHSVLTQLNRVSHEIAERVSWALGLEAPAPDPKYYHDNKTSNLSILAKKLPTVATLRVGVLVSVESDTSLEQASQLKDVFAANDVVVAIVGEALANGVDQTYSAAFAGAFDGVIITSGAKSLFESGYQSTLYPLGRPSQILLDAYQWGKPVGGFGSDSNNTLFMTDIQNTTGVYVGENVRDFVANFEDGLKTFKFVDRFPIDDL